MFLYSVFAQFFKNRKQNPPKLYLKFLNSPHISLFQAVYASHTINVCEIFCKLIQFVRVLCSLSTASCFLKWVSFICDDFFAYCGYYYIYKFVTVAEGLPVRFWIQFVELGSFFVLEV